MGEKSTATMELIIEDADFNDFANGETLTMVEMKVAEQTLRINLARKAKKAAETDTEGSFLTIEVLMEEGDFTKFEQGSPFILVDMNVAGQQQQIILQRKQKRKKKEGSTKPSTL